MSHVVIRSEVEYCKARAAASPVWSVLLVVSRMSSISEADGRKELGRTCKR